MITNSLILFPTELHEVIKEMSLEHNLEFKQNTYFESINRELVWFKKNSEYRLDFTLLKSSIAVTYFITPFPWYPKLLIWCHKYIPMFPYYPKITWYQLPDLPLDLNKQDYKNIIEKYINKIKSNDLIDKSIFLNINQRR